MEQRKQDATANLTDYFSVYVPFGDDYFTRREAGCIARRVVEEPGLRRLQRAGILNDELQYVIDADPRFTRGDALAVTRALFDCSDAEEAGRQQVVADLPATEAQKKCAARAIDEDLLVRMFVLALREVPLDPIERDLAAAFQPCRAT